MPESQSMQACPKCNAQANLLFDAHVHSDIMAFKTKDVIVGEPREPVMHTVMETHLAGVCIKCALQVIDCVARPGDHAAIQLVWSGKEEHQ